MIHSLIHSPKTYLSTLPHHLRAPAIEAYAISLRTTFAFTAAIGVLSFIAAWPVQEFSLGEKGARVGGGKQDDGERDGER